MKRPRRAEQDEKPLQRRHENERLLRACHVVENARDRVDDDHGEAVDRVKVRRERDPKVVRVGNDVSAVAAPALEFFHAPLPRPDPDRVRELVAENVEPQRPRPADRPEAGEEPKRPQRRAQAEEPELVRAPKLLLDRRAMERIEKRLREHPDQRQQADAGEEFDMANGNHPRLRSPLRRRQREPLSRLAIARRRPGFSAGFRLGFSGAAHEMGDVCRAKFRVGNGKLARSEKSFANSARTQTCVSS